MKFKKIATVLGSALMVGSTIGLAAAAAYPTPFVQNGAANVAIVVGTNGAEASDMVAATDISADLAKDLSAQAVGGVTTVTGGDSYKVEKTSIKYHIGDAITSIITTLDDGELPTLLADGVFLDNDNDEFDYTQKIELNGSILSMFEDNDYAENEPTVGFRIASGQNVLNYTITFSDQPTIADITTTLLPIMGKEYYVLSNSTSGANLILTLLDSAVDTTVSEGETKTLDVDGTSYEVAIDFISTTEVKLNVNGETTNSLAEASTYKLSDGSYVGIKDISVQDYAGGIKKVEFSIGSGKLKLTSGSEIQINDQAIPGLSSTIVNASGMSDTGTLTSIEITWNADDDLFITEGTEITMPGFEAVKMSYGGATYPTEEVIEVRQGSDTYVVLENFPLKDGAADIPILYGTAGGNFSGIGKDANNRLITSNTSTLTFDKDTDEMFIVSYAATTEGESYIMRATNFVLDGTNNETDIQYYKDGVWTDTKTGAKDGDTFSIGNAELGVGAVNRASKTAVITANSSSTNFFHLYSAEGLRTYLPFTSTAVIASGAAIPNGQINFTLANSTSGHNQNNFTLWFNEEDKDGNIGAGPGFQVSVGQDSSTVAEPEVSGLVNESVTAIEIGETDVWRSFMYSALATEFLWEKPTSGQDSIKIIYHGDEVVADVYVTGPDATLSNEGAELGTITVLDSEASEMSGKNLIVVGGNCVNSVAAELLGLEAGESCLADFTAKTGVADGGFLIQSFDKGGKVAILVAGYSATDTRAKAATYLVNNNIETSVGTVLKGTSATEATVVTA